MGPKKTPIPPTAIVNRLDEGLSKTDLEFVKDEFVKFVVDHNLDLRTWRASKKDNIDNFLGHLQDATPQWAGLGPIDDIWEETAIHHLKQHIKNQTRDAGAPLVARMVNYRRSKEQGGDHDVQDAQIDSTAKSKKATPKKVLGKRDKSGSIDHSAGKPSPGRNVQI